MSNQKFLELRDIPTFDSSNVRQKYDNFIWQFGYRKSVEWYQN